MNYVYRPRFSPVPLSSISISALLSSLAKVDNFLSVHFNFTRRAPVNESVDSPVGARFCHRFSS